MGGRVERRVWWSWRVERDEEKGGMKESILVVGFSEGGGRK